MLLDGDSASGMPGAFCKVGAPQQGHYILLHAFGPVEASVCAFARPHENQRAIVTVPHLKTLLAPTGGWLIGEKDSWIPARKSPSTRPTPGTTLSPEKRSPPM